MTEIIFDEHEDWEKRILCSDGSCIGTIGPTASARNAANPMMANCRKNKYHKALI